MRLAKSSVRASLSPAAAEAVKQIHLFQEIESTNSFLIEHENQIGNAEVCLAESQTKGRGRHGNQWGSTPNKNILMSMSWTFASWPDTITGLSLAVGMVIAERLNQNYQQDVRVKWPNDLMVNDQKLGGILIELSGNGSGSCTAVIGLGLNVHQSDWVGKAANPAINSGFRSYAWQDLFSLGAEVDRNLLIGQLVSDWVLMLKEFGLTGFAPWTEHWSRLSTYSGVQIRVGNEEKHTIGTMRGVDQYGALLLDGADGKLHTFSESNVSVRLVVPGN